MSDVTWKIQCLKNYIYGYSLKWYTSATKKLHKISLVKIDASMIFVFSIPAYIVVKNIDGKYILILYT